MTLQEELSPEFLQSLPQWIQEGRAPTAEEYGEWARSQKGACQDYKPMEPISHYQGMCGLYVWNQYRHCGVPFISKLFCRTGQVEEGKTIRLTTKDFRKNYDRWVRGTITYTCEECNRFFISGRARSGPKICGECIGELRKRGLGPMQRRRLG